MRVEKSCNIDAWSAWCEICLGIIKLVPLSHMMTGLYVWLFNRYIPASGHVEGTANKYHRIGLLWVTAITKTCAGNKVLLLNIHGKVADPYQSMHWCLRTEREKQLSLCCGKVTHKRVEDIVPLKTERMVDFFFFFLVFLVKFTSCFFHEGQDATWTTSRVAHMYTRNAPFVLLPWRFSLSTAFLRHLSFQQEYRACSTGHNNHYRPTHSLSGTLTGQCVT